MRRQFYFNRTFLITEIFFVFGPTNDENYGQKGFPFKGLKINRLYLYHLKGDRLKMQDQTCVFSKDEEAKDKWDEFYD